MSHPSHADPSLASGRAAAAGVAGSAGSQLCTVARQFGKVRLDRDCPQLREAVDELFDLLRECDVDPRHALGSSSPGALLTRLSTPAMWIAAGWLSESQWHAALATCGAEAFLATGGSASEFTDGWLVPELVTAAAHFPAAAHRHPTKLRDALAALAAVEANRALIDPTLLPDALQGRGCWVRPQLAQSLFSGRFLADRVGLEAAIAAAAGAAPIADALDEADLSEFEALWRDSHAASALVPTKAAPLNEHTAVWMEDAILLATARRRRERGLAQPAQWLPSGGGLHLDLALAVLRPLGPPATLVQHTDNGWLDPEVLRVALPAGPCVRATNHGWAALDVAIAHFDELDDLVVALLDALDDPPRAQAGPHTVGGDGFELRWLPVADTLGGAPR